MHKTALIFGLLAICGATAYVIFDRTRTGDHHQATVVTAVVEPNNYSLQAKEGRNTFQKNCSDCHGQIGQGTEKGPPLVHTFYQSNHHADGAFFLAVRNGVRAHHWKFGDMPAQPEVTDAEVSKIVAYVRALQSANGIE